MTASPRTATPTTGRVVVEEREFVGVVSSTDVAPRATSDTVDRPRHWLPGAGLLPRDFFLSTVAVAAKRRASGLDAWPGGHMSWKPIVVGVDTSPEAAGAAAFACRMAGAADTTCHLVHAVRDVWAAVPVEEGVDELRRALMDDARADITAALKDAVPREPVDKITVRLGRAPVVLKQAVTDRGAELVVLGGKHHSTVARWLAGSTSLDVARTTEVPVLVTAGSPREIRRVLVAVDLSRAAGLTLRAAERYAGMFGAELRALSVFEPIPVIPEVTPEYDTADYYALSEELLNRDIWSLIETRGVEKVVRYGMAVETILREAVEWQADLLVLGSHGKGWAERVLVGSVTERLLNHLPTSLLVVPAAAPAVVEPVEEEHAAAVA